MQKYANPHGKDSKYTNAIDISIIWYCGRGRRRRHRVICREGVEGLNLSVEEEVEGVGLSVGEEVES